MNRTNNACPLTTFFFDWSRRGSDLPSFFFEIILSSFFSIIYRLPQVVHETVYNILFTTDINISVTLKFQYNYMWLLHQGTDWFSTSLSCFANALHTCFHIILSGCHLSSDPFANLEKIIKCTLQKGLSELNIVMWAKIEVLKNSIYIQIEQTPHVLGSLKVEVKITTQL